MAAGKQQAAAAEAQATESEQQATQEVINGREDALNAMRQLNKDLSSITVAGYASGLSPTGSVQAAKDQAGQIGEANINTARNNSQYASAQRRQQAQQYRNEAQGARTQGLLGAVQGGLSLFSRRQARG